MDQQTMRQHGAFSWNELMTTDVPAAKAFYGQLFDWDMQDEKTCDMSYTMARAGQQEVAGIMAMPPEAGGAPPAWGAYVTVDDVDQRSTQVEKLGGKIIIPARDIPNVGRFVVIADPQGAVLALITYTHIG
ncbi:VOC family protein [Sulfuriflexus mobilis]|uniref:VOC family protein n=1 Tax=Sulfuriflexus mobilis TaxID=1811807 RepID=UPI000F82DDD6|nr:VOC family protein [Sulfuriflexus mobilis]